MANQDNTDETPVIATNGVEPDVENVPTMKELTGIKYVGMADVKRLEISDLESLGIESPKGDLVWSADNDFTVPASEINAATRDALLANKDFVVA